MTLTTTQWLKKLRHLVWPVYGRAEHQRILPMLLVFFLIAFVYNLMRPSKTALLVNASGLLGAGIIPFLKLWVVLPGAFLITYIYTTLTKKLDRDAIFYITISFFIGYYMLFSSVFLPNAESLSLEKASNFLQAVLPEAMQGLSILVKHWYLSLFYLLSELWSSVVLAMLFWGFANEVTSIEEAKRFYGSFVLSANLSGIASGYLGKTCFTLEKPLPGLPYAHDLVMQSVFLVTIVCFVSGLVIMALYKHIVWQNKNLLGNKFQLKEKKAKIGFIEAAESIVKSKYLLCIALMVIAYNIIYNLSEVIWADQIQHAAQGRHDQMTHKMYDVSLWTGLVSTFLAIFVCGNALQLFGWTRAALIAPVVWLLTGLCLFGTWFAGENSILAVFASSLNMSLMSFVSVLSSIQICLGRSTKYTVFDETKEIAFIPLSIKDKRRGKAIVDGVTGWIGRSGGALIYQILFFYLVGVQNVIPYVAIIFFAMLVLWIYCVLILGRKIQAHSELEESKAVVAQA
ncbi:MAG: Npt1/Npt2 family nucleotide transporter [Gammaproteobacteria bacterium]